MWMWDVAVILAEPSNVSHDSSSITAQPCKLLPKKTYPNGHSKEYYQDLAYCVADYHKENSFETINLNFKIYDNNGDWFRTDKNEEDYIDEEHEFVIDAINLVINKGINLSDKDIIIVVHSGTSYQKAYHPIWNRHPQKLWTETWTPDSQPLGWPPFKIVIAEDDIVGPWAHETGHIIGALTAPQSTITPDIYKMGNVGKWDLMADGPWNDGGKNPPYMSSYIKEFLQWLNYDIYPKSAYGEYWINSLETSELGDDIFRYNLSDDIDDSSPKYYILEARNRNLKTWDSSLPGLPIIGDKNLVLYYVDTKELPEYGYVPEGVIEYQKGMMWNQYRTVTIPGNALINDAVLSPSINETYRDFDELVKFTAQTDRTINDRYEIQAKIEEISYDSFIDTFWGVILRPGLIFRQKIKRILPLNPIETSEFHKVKSNPLRTQVAITSADPESGEVGTPLKTTRIAVIKQIYLMLAFVILFNLILVWLNVKIIPHWKSKRGKRTMKIVFRIIWAISIIVFIVLSYSLIIAYQEKEAIPKPGEIRNSPMFEPITAPDLDLHLYTDDGRHIGMNYETGEYEIQIEGVIVSGDAQDAPEWIFIPPDVTNYHFVVSSHDNQKFLEENPEIAQEIEDTTDSYKVYARYIDPEVAIYTSAVISEDIKPAEELEHPITGTTDITVLPAVPWETPKFLKETSITKLEEAKTNDKKIDKELDKIIKYIQKSLDNKLWIDDSHLDPKHGKKVFHEEYKALKKMQKEIKKKKIPVELKETFRELIDKLVKADKMLAKVTIEDAKLIPVQDPKNQKKVNHEIEKAENELAKAYKELEKDKSDKAIKRFEKAWKHAQLAIKFAKLEKR